MTALEIAVLLPPALVLGTGIALLVLAAFRLAQADRLLDDCRRLRAESVDNTDQEPSP
ncbi:hypothetical protein ABE438_17550 [Bosea sp. TWI1241]|uniref:hypothetical protein n=1 Tax=Bosea sp. TWI1241 TaxID=3148904 RepID=UPI0032082D25